MKILRFCGLAILLLSKSAWAQTAGLSLPDAVGISGSTVSIAVSMTGSTPISAGQVGIEFDGNVLQLNGVTLGPGISGIAITNINTSLSSPSTSGATASVLVQFAGTGSVSGPADILLLDFTAAGPPGSISLLAFDTAANRTSLTTTGLIDLFPGSGLTLTDGQLSVLLGGVAIRIQTVNADPGAEVAVPVEVSTPLQAGIFQFTVEYPGSDLNFLGADAVAPGFATPTVNENISQSFPPTTPGTDANVLIQIPGDGQIFITGSDVVLLILRFDVSPGAAPGALLPLGLRSERDLSSVSILNPTGTLQTVFGSGLELIDGAVDVSGPILSVSPLNFGSVQTGQSLTLTLIVSNDLLAFAPGTVTGIAFQQGSSGDFTIDLSNVTFPVSLAPGQDLQIPATFTPTVEGAATATIEASSLESPTKLASLTGTGVRPITGVEPGSHNFGEVPVGGSAVDLTATVSNGQGASGNLTVNSIQFQGPGGDFTLDVANFTFPQNMAPGESIQFTARFSPTGQGLSTATVQVNTTGSIVPVNLTGTGVRPFVDVSPLSLPFGNAKLGQIPSPTLTFRVSNLAPATADLAVNVAFQGGSGGDFALSNLPPPVLPSGGFHDVTVTYTPTATGLATATVLVNTNDPDQSTVPVDLTGTGTEPDIAVLPPDHDFGSVTAGQVPPPFTFTVTNNGTADLIVSNIVLVDASGSFAFVPIQVPFTLTPGESRNVTGIFAPVAAGSFSAQINFHSDDPDTGVLPAGMTGTGIALPPTPTTPATPAPPPPTTTPAPTSPPPPSGGGGGGIGIVSVNNPPTIGNIGTQTAIQENPITFTVPVSDDRDSPGQITVRVSTRNRTLIPVVQESGRSITLTPQAGFFSTTIGIRAEDSEGAESPETTVSLSWTQRPNRPPEIQGTIGDRTAAVNQAIVLDLSSHETDPDNPPGTDLDWTVSGVDAQLVSGENSDDDRITIEPTGAERSVVVTLTLSDGQESVSVPVTLTWEVRVTVDFTATPVEDTKPLTVAFGAQVTGATESVSYAWDFGDLNTGTGAAPTHTYTEAGDYNVTLTVSGSETGPQGVTETKNAFIRVLEEPPDGIIGADRQTGTEVPFAVQFTVTLLGGPVTDFLWDFGDPASGALNSSTEQNPSHTYTGEGIYDVSVTLTGPGGVATPTQTEYIEIRLLGVIVNFTATPPSGTGPLTVLFQNQSQSASGGDLTLQWDFGDPASGPLNSSTGQNPIHTYDLFGPYTVILTVTDDQGQTFTNQTNIEVNPVLPVVGIQASVVRGEAPLVVDFTASVDPDNPNRGEVTGRWDFGDGTSPVEATWDYRTDDAPPGILALSHTFQNNGAYPVTFTVTGPGGTGQAAVEIVVALNQPPPAVDADTISPPDGTTGVDRILIVSWGQVFDPNGDLVTYNLSMRVVGGPSGLVAGGLTETQQEVGPLEQGATYILELEAVDALGAASDITESSFTTSGDSQGPVSDRSNPPFATALTSTSVLIHARTDEEADLEVLIQTLGEPDRTVSSSGRNTNFELLIDGLTTGGTYAFTLTATDENNNATTFSPAVVFTMPQALPPLAFETLPVLLPQQSTSTSLTFFWETNLESTTEGQVLATTRPAATKQPAPANLDTKHTFTLENLAPATTHTVELTSESLSGERISAPGEGTTRPPGSVEDPPAMSLAVVTFFTSTSYTVEWESTTEASGQLIYSLNPSLQPPIVVDAGTGIAFSVTVPGEPGKTYYFQGRVVNNNGEDSKPPGQIKLPIAEDTSPAAFTVQPAAVVFPDGFMRPQTMRSWRPDWWRWDQTTRPSKRPTGIWTTRNSPG